MLHLRTQYMLGGNIELRGSPKPEQRMFPAR